MTRTLTRILYLLLFTIFVGPVLAQDYADGRQAYLDKDYERAHEILRPLAEQGNSEAQVTLGLMYDFGHGVKRDPATAIEWYTRAAEQGMPLIQHDLGVKYFEGQDGVPQDYRKAIEWWEQAANAGLADSQFNLGLMYYRSLGTEQDFPRAAAWFRQAAEQDHPNAQYSLAVMYAFAQGVEQDYQQALRWFGKAAEENIPQAQYNLGVFHENGYGVEPDMEAARKWYRLAADQGLNKARERLAELDRAEPGTEIVAEAVPAVTADPGPQSTATRAADPLPRTASATPSAGGDFHRDDWVRQRSASRYTLQVLSMTDEQAVAKFIRDHRLGPDAGYIKVVIDGTTRYNAIVGDYDSHAAAQAAISQLPQGVQRNQPWVRNFGVLQKLMP